MNPILGWALLVGGLLIAGWATSFPIELVLTKLSGGDSRDPNRPLERHRWALSLALAVIYLIAVVVAVNATAR